VNGSRRIYYDGSFARHRRDEGFVTENRKTPELAHNLQAMFGAEPFV
jgi:hypothetical protein